MRGPLPALVLSVVAAFGPWGSAPRAADLPFAAGDPAFYRERVEPPRIFGAMGWPVRPEPRRFDIYGNPLGGFFAAVPDPLVVSNGCPKAVQPVYDITGNLAGYAPLVVCQ